MPNEPVPPSSAELSRWLKHARESRATIERGVRGLDKALHEIEALAVKAPPEPKDEDAPAIG